MKIPFCTKKLIIISILISFFSCSEIEVKPTQELVSPKSCSTMDESNLDIHQILERHNKLEEIEKHYQEYIRKYPNGESNRNTITIPVVVHVLYRTTTQNISDSQIFSQINSLNKDFSGTNSDTILIPNDFKSLKANCEIQFCLAKTDPNGKPTTGITRKQTKITSFTTNNRVKQTSLGGVNPWNTSQYLNIWVCVLANSIVGYSQMPGGDPATDGVVIDYRYFGTMGTATAPYNKGRVTTHEIGHWLNLKHIWGDATCGDDLVSDTPIHNGPNYYCQIQPHYSQCGSKPREMTMNYMDYSDDACMFMFTNGQKQRMRAVLSSGGFRNTLVNSHGCNP